MTRKTKAFTLVELLVVIAIIALLIGLLLPAIAGARRAAIQAKDSTQVRAMHQGLVAWSQNDKGLYPTPSVLDARNATLDFGNGINIGNKNTTGAIWSILMFNKVIAEGEIFVSPAEVNPFIREIAESEFDFVRPGDNTGKQNTKDPINALWDPSFKSAPVASNKCLPSGVMSDVPEDIGNNSYATISMRPNSNYRKKWSVDSGFANIPVVSNRGPEFATAQHSTDIPATADDWELLASPAEKGIDSNTLRIHGGKSTWEGAVGYNDGHVVFEQSFAPQQLAITFRNKTVSDNLFASEIALNSAADLREDAFLRVFHLGLPLNQQNQDQSTIYYAVGAGSAYNWVD